VAPLDQVEAVILGKAAPALTAFRGLRWPGYVVGVGEMAEPGRPARPTLVLATRPAPDQLVIVANGVNIIISPFDGDNFKSCLEALQATYVVEQSDLRPAMSFLAWPVWSDGLAWLVGLAAPVINLLLFGYLAALYSRLPPEVPLHFNRAGEVDRTGAPTGLLVVPLAGLLTWLLLGFLGWFFYQVRGERPVALILWAGSVAIQLAAWYVILGLLGQIG
jgi:hypothetical protein